MLHVPHSFCTADAWNTTTQSQTATHSLRNPEPQLPSPSHGKLTMLSVSGKVNVLVTATATI